ncbi:hypothetical protein CEXT_181821 [Caerostris extrusa]|uniref:Uncharacterized protein n=1 Tax=Caerostris extrusa TaxID=172846 RepID=A0AAV4UV26_CAEEX|nr:hypothetical protein CEXT_181821 [Caerostris extrusa]
MNFTRQTSPNSPFPGCDPALPSLLCRRLPKSIDVYFGARLPYTSHARHLQTAPFAGVILPFPPFLRSRLLKSIGVYFRSPDSDTPTPDTETEASTNV